MESSLVHKPLLLVSLSTQCIPELKCYIFLPSPLLMVSSASQLPMDAAWGGTFPVNSSAQGATFPTSPAEHSVEPRSCLRVQSAGGSARGPESEGLLLVPSVLPAALASLHMQVPGSWYTCLTSQLSHHVHSGQALQAPGNTRVPCWVEL
jgi:hypothetical protein